MRDNNLNLYQITVVYDDHSISVRPYNPYIKTNSITSNERYYPYNANISRFPKIEEFEHFNQHKLFLIVCLFFLDFVFLDFVCFIDCFL